MGARSQLLGGLAMCYRMLGQYDRARVYAHQRWGEDWKDGADCAFDLGSFAADSGNLEEAEWYFRLCLNMTPLPVAGPMNQTSTEKTRELALYGLAVIFFKRGLITESVVWLAQAEQHAKRPQYRALRQRIIEAVQGPQVAPEPQAAIPPPAELATEETA
jgi:tetratricopeptide (TPR) repeat protein